MTSALLSSPSGTFEIFTAEHHDDKVTGPECKECTTIVNLLEQSIGSSSTTQVQQRSCMVSLSVVPLIHAVIRVSC